MDKYQTIKKVGMLARGRKELLKHLDGQRLTQRQAILAKCYDCLGYYADGKVCCEITDCPLFPYMPYRKVSEKKEEALENTPV